jgi:hypothetical protein
VAYYLAAAAAYGAAQAGGAPVQPQQAPQVDVDLGDVPGDRVKKAR